MSIVKIAYNAVKAKLLTDDPIIKGIILNDLTYEIKGAEHTDAFKNGWSGSSTFFSYNSNTFPAGFVLSVKSTLKRLGYTVQLLHEDLPKPLFDGKPVISNFPEDPRYSYQWETIERLLKYGKMIAQISTGGGKSLVALYAIKKIGRKTLFITTRSLLMYQMKRQLEEIGYDVGVIGDGIYDPKPLVNVAMVQTLGSSLTVRTVEEEIKRVEELEKKKIQKLLDTKRAELYSLWHKEKITQKELDTQYRSYQQSLDRKTRDDIRKKAIESCKDMNADYKKTKEFLETVEFVIAEEAHESSGNEYYNIMQHCVKAHYRLALTATPFMRGDEAADMKLMACSGHVGIKVSEKQLIDCGILATPYFKFIPMTNCIGLYPTTPWARAYEIGIVKNPQRNNLILKESILSKENKVPNLVLVQRQDHGKNLCKLLSDAGIKCDFIFGETDKLIREQKLKELSDGTIDTLIGSTILDVGVDVPAIGKIILAGGGKAEVALRQRIGRGLRAKKKGNYTFVVDFIDCGNEHLSKHYQTRKKIIQDTPGFGENILNKNEDFNYSLLEK